MLDKAFINKHNTIELPGPFFTHPKLKEELDMWFTNDLITGIQNILPTINEYEFKTYKDSIRIKYTDDSSDTIIKAVQSSNGWKIDSNKKVITFCMSKEQPKK